MDCLPSIQDDLCQIKQERLKKLRRIFLPACCVDAAAVGLDATGLDVN